MNVAEFYGDGVQLVCEPVGTTKWREHLLGTIGGSAAASACSQGRFDTRRALFDRLLDVRHGNADGYELPQTPDMRRGKLLEPIALQVMSEALDAEVVHHPQDVFVYNPRYPWAHSLPDGYVPDSPRRMIVEAKVPRPYVLSQIIDGGLPAYYVAQAQHNMALCNAAVCVFGLLNPITCEVHALRIDRDDDLINRIMGAEEQLSMAVSAETYVALPGEAETVLGELLVDNSGELVETDDPEIVAAVRRVIELRDDHSRIEEELEITRGALGALIEKFTRVKVRGVDTMAEFANKRYRAAMLTYKKREGARRFDVKRFQADNPSLDLDKYFKQDAASRPLLVHPSGA